MPGFEIAVLLSISDHGVRIRFGKPDASLCANGWLAGLVASSASAALVSPLPALFIGIVAGVITPLLVELLELAVSIEDILARRVGLQLYGWRDAIRAAPAVAELLARELGWPEGARQLAITEYVAKIQGLIVRAGI